MILYSLLFIYVAQLILYLYYYIYIYDKNRDLIELKYDDLHHIKKGIKGFLVASMDLSLVENETLNLFEKKLKDLIVKEVAFRLEKTKQENILKITKKPLNELYNQINLHGFQPENNQDLLLKTFQSNNLISFVINEKQKRLYFCFNHGIMDGISARNSIVEIFKPKNKNAKSIPVIKNNVFIFLYSLIKLSLNCNNIKFIKQPVFFSESEKSQLFSFSINKKKIDTITKEKKSSFNAAIQSVIFEYLYDYRQQFNVVTICGGERSQYFNNHGVIPYSIKLSKNKDNIPNQIDKLLKKNSFLAPINLNKPISNWLKNKKNNIDIMFSGAPFSSEKLYLGDSYILNHKCYIPYHSIPVYVLSIKLEDKIHFSIGVRDIKLQQFLKKYNWEIIN